MNGPYEITSCDLQPNKKDPTASTGITKQYLINSLNYIPLPIALRDSHPFLVGLIEFRFGELFQNFIKMGKL